MSRSLNAKVGFVASCSLFKSCLHNIIAKGRNRDKASGVQLFNHAVTLKAKMIPWLVNLTHHGSTICNIQMQLTRLGREEVGWMKVLDSAAIVTGIKDLQRKYRCMSIFLNAAALVHLSFGRLY